MVANVIVGILMSKISQFMNFNVVNINQKAVATFTINKKYLSMTSPRVAPGAQVECIKTILLYT